MHTGYNAANSQDSYVDIFFKTSNGSSVDGNGFAGNSFYATRGFRVQDITPKWVSSAAGAAATSYDLYLYLPAYTLKSHYLVEISQGTTWTNLGTLSQTDPGVGSSTVLLSTAGYNITVGNVGIGNTTPAHKLRVEGTTSLAGAVSGITTLAAGNTTITGFVNASSITTTGLVTLGTGSTYLNRVITTLDQGVNNTTYEIARISRDSANWSTQFLEITVFNHYYRGGKTKWNITYNQVDAGTITCEHASGTIMHKVYLGAEVLVSGTIYYRPVLIDLPQYTRATIEVNHGYLTEVASITNSSQIYFTNTDVTIASASASYSGDIHLNPSGGNTGIGNTSPAHKLRVTGTTSLAGAVSDITTLAAGNTTITGFVNATSSLAVGTAFTANATVVNAVSYYAGTLLVANTTVVNATHLGGTAASGYQTTAGLSANVATLTSNNATNAFGKTEGNLNVNAAAQLVTTRTINGVNFNGTANILVPSTYDANYRRIDNPGGAEYIPGTASVTGAFQVVLPVGWTNSMVRMTIKIYDYAANKGFDVVCGGYNYVTGSSWINTFAYILADKDEDRRFTVRFGYNAGGKCVIYIGELASTWSYPQVFVTDVQVGHAGQSVSWVSGWTMGIQASAFENVTSTITSTQVGYGTSTSTTDALVLRDASANFSTNNITANTTGIHTGNVVATTVNATANVTVGANVLINTSAFVVSNTTAITTHTILGVNAGNSSVITAPQIIVQNTAGTTTVNSNFISTTSLSGNLTGNVAATTITASANLTVGSLLVANTTVVNATHLGGKTEVNLNVNNSVFMNGNTVITVMENLRANRNISGGGTITVDASYNVLWSTRFIVISNGRGTHFSTAGYFDITCPTTGTITGVGGATSKTATAAGIPLAIWDALYYILPIGSASTSLAANFRVVNYTADVEIPSDWVLICIRNAESATNWVSFPNGINLLPSQSYNTTIWSSSVVPTANNSSFLTGYTFAAPSVLGATTANGASLTYANVSGQVNTATLYATTSANIASAVQANATGVWTTGTVNGAVHSIGTTLVANTIGIYHTGTVNAASHTVGTAFTANATVVNAASYNISTTLVANTTGVYHTGTVNAAIVSSTNATFTRVTDIVQAAGDLRTNLGNPTVEEKALFHGQFNNKFRFISPTSQEESTDGVTWTGSTRATAAQLGDMMIGEGQGTSFDAIPTGTAGTAGYYRLTWDVVGTTGYVFLNHLYVYASTQGNQVTFTVEAYNNTTTLWENYGSGTSSNWPGHFSLKHATIPYSSSAAQYSRVRVTFVVASRTNTNTIQLYAIEWFGGYPAAKRNVQSYDRLKNVTFPANVAATGALTVGTAFIADASGIVNAASYTIGTSFIANTTGAYHTGVVNAASHTVGTTFTANSTVVNAVAYNIGTSFIANTTGIYHTGTVNATSLSVGTAALYANAIGTYTNQVAMQGDNLNRLVQGALILRSTAPTIYFRDTDHNSAMLQNNSNLLQVLRGANDTETSTQVNGQWPFSWNLTNNDASCGGSFSAVGNITAYTSDRRLKKDIELIVDALEKVNQISGITYKNNELANSFGFNDDDEQVGVIAQEIEKVLPQVVAPAPFDIEIDAVAGTKKSKSGENYMTVRYDRIVPLLIEAIKELSSQVEAMKLEIQELKK